MPPAVIGIGSNLGNKLQTCRQAVSLLQAMQGYEVLRLSSWYETVPVGYTDQPVFLNGVLVINTSATPRSLFAMIKEIERKLGRKKTWRDGPRIIDLDLILYGDLILDQIDLIIPHPRFIDRAFVLVPLAEIWPDLIHPVNQKSMADLLKQLGPVDHLIKSYDPSELEPKA